MLPEIKRILYATDMSESSRRAFQYALALAKKCQAKIVVFHVMMEIPAYALAYAGSGLDKKEMLKGHLDRLKEEVHDFCEEETCKLPEGQEAVEKIEVKEGNPAWLIINEAKAEKVDLIVLGQHGRSVFTEALVLGGTARRVVTHSEIPVLTVRLPKK